jgi:hypothetical protein
VNTDAPIVRVVVVALIQDLFDGPYKSSHFWPDDFEAIDDGFLGATFFVGDTDLGPLLVIEQRDIDRAGDVAGVEFRRRPYVDRGDVVVNVEEQLGW